MFKRPMMAAVMVGCVLAGAGTLRGQMPSGWNCLPEETLLAIRIPDGEGFMQQLRDQTQFGAVMLSDDRLNGFIELYKKQHPSRWREMEESLGRHDLKPEDWTKLLGSDFGYGMVAHGRGEDREPLMVGLMWSQTGEDLGGRLMRAVADMIEHQETEHPATRVDIRLADTTVMHLTFPHLGVNYDDIAWPEIDWANMNQEEIQEAFRQHEERLQAVEPEVVDYIHVMVAQVGDRFVLAHTTSQSREQVTEAKRAGEPVDIAAVTGVDMVTTTFARFLEAHQRGGDEFAARMLGARGVRAAMPRGRLGAEFVFNGPRMMNLLRDGEPEAFGYVSQSGFETLGVVAVQATLDGQVLRSSAFMSLPTPRRAFASLLDHSPRAAEPAAWVQSDVLEYIHFLLPLDKLYAQIRQVMLAQDEGGEMAMGFEMMEAQVNEVAQTSLSSVLAALGDQHIMVRYMPKMPDPQAAEEDEWAMDEPMERFSFVWALTDEGVIRTLMQNLTPMITGMGGLQAVEEQGFSGFRPPDEFEDMGGLFFGRGYLIFSTGEGVVEQTLAMLRQPPTPEASLRQSDLFQRAKSILTPKPSIIYGITDTQRYMSGVGMFLKNAVVDWFYFGGFDDMTEIEDGMQAVQIEAELDKLLPSEEETRTFFGVTVQQVFVNEDGVVMESAMELPSPR